MHPSELNSRIMHIGLPSNCSRFTLLSAHRARYFLLQKKIWVVVTLQDIFLALLNISKKTTRLEKPLPHAEEKLMNIQSLLK